MAFTIASSGTTSNSLQHLTGSMTIHAPAALTGTVKVEVSGDGGATWNTLSDAGADLTIAAGDSVTISGNLGLVRVKSGSAEGAARVFPTTTTRTAGGRGVVTGTTEISGDLDMQGHDIDDGGTVTAGLFSGPATALKSATTTVGVAAATAPTSGQVLTATSGTAATWQDAAGGASTQIVTKVTADSPYALAAGDTTVLGNTVGGDLTVTLPASPTTGRIVNIKKIAAANELTIDGNGKNIDGAATVVVITSYPNYQLQYTGTEWSVL